jgi:hypothetical protein
VNAAGNPRLIIHVAAELLAVAAARKLTRLDESRNVPGLAPSESRQAPPTDGGQGA